MIGVGVGVGFGGGGGRKSAAPLAAGLADLLGATLVGLWIPDDAIVDGSNNILSVTGRVGGDAANVGAGYLSRVALNGRFFLSNTQVATTVALRTASLTIQYAFSVQRVGVLPFADYRCAIGSTGPTVNKLVLTGSSGTSNYYAAAGYRHLSEAGDFDEAVPTGIHVARSVITNSATSDTDTWEIGGRLVDGAVRNFIGDVGTVAMLSAIPSDLVAASVTELLNAYYSI